MKTFCCGLVLVVCGWIGTVGLHAQQPDPRSFFPHHVGDTWEYASYEPGIGRRDTFQTRIVKDSITADGTFYVKFEGGYGGSFVTDSLNQVFSIGAAGSAKVYDFAAPIGAWWRSPPAGAMEVDTIFESTVFGVAATIKVFNHWFGAVDSSFVFNRDYLASGFGLVQSDVYEADFNTTYVIGAIIDGVRYGTLTSVSANLNTYPADYELMQNYPNPFNPSTTIEYQLAHGAVVHLIVIDLLGQEVATLVQSMQSAGRHKVVWNGMDRNENRVSSGVYLYSLNVEQQRITRKLVVVR
jgi:hypothetical protein